MTSPPTGFRYKAFLSYSHAADGKLAPALKSALERFAKPWYRRRALRVFHDQTGLAVTPALWRAIQAGLETSEYFVLLASPAAARSEWVTREVAFWLEHRPVETLLIVVTDGTIAWDSQTADFDWAKTDALPRVLERRIREEPNYLDLRWVRADTDLSLRRPRFLDAVAGLVATLRQVQLDELISEDVSQYEAARRLLRSAIVLLVLFALAAGYAAYQANRAREVAGTLQADQLARDADARDAAARARETEAVRRTEAERARVEAALSRGLAAKAIVVLRRDRQLATLLALEAVQRSPTPEAEDALRRALVTRGSPGVLRGPTDDAVRGVEFSADGGRLLSVQASSSVWIWTLPARSAAPIVIPRDAIAYPRADSVSAGFSPDGTQVLTAPSIGPGSFQASDSDNPAARLWDAATGRQVRELKHRYLQYAAFSPDGKRIITVGFDAPTVVVWDARTGERLLELTDDEDEVVSVDFTRDGAMFVTASKGDLVRVRESADGRTLAQFRVPGKTFMKGALVSPDGRRVLTMSSDDPARLWDWRDALGSPMAELAAHGRIVDYAVFSPDSARLVTLAGDDHTARVWDVATGRNVQSLEHEDFIGGAAFSPDSRWIATVSSDGTAVLWDASNGRSVMDFGRHEHSRSSVAFSRDGRLVATGTGWGRILLESCDVCGPSSDLIALARARVKRVLTPEERQRFGID
jgi:WD40 repeat protein